MKRKIAQSLSLVLVSILLSTTNCLVPAQKAPILQYRIVIASHADLAERLAVKEVRRYLYLRTGKLLPIVQKDGNLPPGTALIVLGSKKQPVIKKLISRDANLACLADSLQPQQYLLKTIGSGKRQVILIAGGDSIGALYGAYRFIEHFGVRFYLHGDSIPDEQIALELPVLDQTGKPLFNLRGIQPFHDFPEGPDWWNTDDYKAIIAQLPKLRMNFIGLHTYPQGHAGPEPTVWIGLAEDIESDGNVRFSPASSYANTWRGNWGYCAKKTSRFSFGAAQLFERDDYGPEVMWGKMPWPKTLEDRNEVFNRTGNMLREAFEYARLLGVKTCVGTETPLTIPEVVKERVKTMGKDPSAPAVVQEVYEGMFQRIMKAYPLDYYWFWTPESWTWTNPKDKQIEATLADFRAAIAAAKKVNAPFTLATCGWVLGPPKDRALFDNVLPKEMPMSCINRNVGFSPVEPGFARVKQRPKWAIAWLEDDPALIIGQLWAGRMRRDAADALAYGCTGLMGIHWRTRILGPNISALAHAAWDQSGWNADFGKKLPPPKRKIVEGREGGNMAQFPETGIADTDDDPLYQTVRWDIKAYYLKVPTGTYTVTLKFCEPYYNAAGKRVFAVKLQDKKIIDKLDIFAQVGKNRALDYTFGDVQVTAGFVRIEFIPLVEYPCIAAIAVEGQGIAKKINCGGQGYKDYQADLSGLDSNGRGRDLPVEDFYADWALWEFGPRVAEPMAKIFAHLDGVPSTAQAAQRKTNLPRPSTWVKGPGGIKPDNRPWEQVRQEYAFVDEIAKLRPKVKGPGNLERFDYWLNSFRYLRAVGKLNCIWARFNAAMKKVKDEKDPQARQHLARQIVLPIRKELVAQAAEVHRKLLSIVTTTGGLGNVANWQQHLLPTLLTQPADELAKIIGEELPAEGAPSKQYDGPPRVIVPTLRSSLMCGEGLKLKIIILSQSQPRKAELYWRALGGGEFNKIPLGHTARSVYSVRIAARQIKEFDFEYYIKVDLSNGQRLIFPATAPRINQTVVVMNPENPN